MILPYDRTAEIFGRYGIEITEKQYAAFEEYARLLLEWNEKMNLTAITDPEGITVKHFLDSLLVFRCCDIKDSDSFIDVGTGAGFPGIPMKIYKTTLECTLLDSLNKRINFLEAVSQATGLSMNCVHSRAENGGRRPELREKFDISVARAVAPLPVLCEYCMAFVKAGGVFIAMKGPNENYKEAYTAYKTMGGEFEKAEEYELPSGEKRQIIVIRKVKETPAKYPRNPGQISKKAL